jgi:hypothetical protein
MSARSEPRRILFLSLASVVLALACSVVGTPPIAPTFDPTTAALEFQNTAVAMRLTDAALNPAQPAPTLPSSTDVPPSVPVFATETPASQIPPDFQKLIEAYSQKGYLSSTEGEYHHLEDFTMASSDRQVVYSKRKTGYDVKDFMVKAHFKWQSAIANPDPGGCGWAFRGTRDSTYFTFVDKDWIYLGMFKGNQWNRYGKTSGNAWIGLGNPAEADVTLTVSKGKAYYIINGAFASSYTLSMDSLTGVGELDYAVVAGTFKDYGTRCEMTNVDLWISNP